MKIVLAILFLVSSTLAGDKAALTKALAACGPEDTYFAVKTHPDRPPVATPEAGKALVYVIADQLSPCTFCAPTTRVGVDGMWVGANHGTSFFSFPVEPGAHHLCTDWQKDPPYDDREAALTSFTAEAGKTYYFYMRIWRGNYYFWVLNLELIDPDEGLYLIARDGFKFSTSQAK